MIINYLISSLYFLYFLLLNGCTSPGPSSQIDVNRTRSGPSEPTSQVNLGQPQKGTTVLLVAGPGMIRDWNQFNQWNHREMSKDLVHVFRDPANHEVEDPKNAKEGIKHVVPKEKLAAELVQAQTQVNTKRLIIFIDTHGAPSGDWCYQSQHGCDLTEDFLIQALQGMAKIKNLNLEHVLIIPTSCYNKPVMDRFAQKAENVTWPFYISFINQTNNNVCYSISPANQILLNTISDTGGRAITDQQLDQFLNATTLDDFLSFDNGIALDPNLVFEHRCLKACPSPLKLVDFGIQVSLQKILRVNPALNFPNEKSLEEILTEAHIDQKYHKYVSKLMFAFSDNSFERVVVGDDLSHKISYPNLANKEYRMLYVEFQQKP